MNPWLIIMYNPCPIGIGLYGYYEPMNPWLIIMYNPCPIGIGLYGYYGLLTLWWRSSSWGLRAGVVVQQQERGQEGVGSAGGAAAPEGG